MPCTRGLEELISHVAWCTRGHFERRGAQRRASQLQGGDLDGPSDRSGGRRCRRRRRWHAIFHGWEDTAETAPAPARAGRSLSWPLGKLVRPRSLTSNPSFPNMDASSKCSDKNTGGSRDTRDRCGPVLGRLYSTAAPPCRAAADRAERRAHSHRTPRETRDRRERARHAVWYGAKPGPYRRRGVNVAGLERVSSSVGDGHGDAAWIRMVTRWRSRTGPHARRGEHLSTCMCGRHEAHRSPPGLRPRRRKYAPGVTLALSRVRAACKCSPRRPLKGKSRPSIARSRAPSGHDRARPPRSPSCPTRGAAARTGWTRRAHD